MQHDKEKGKARKKLGRFFTSLGDRFSMDIVDLISAVNQNDTETVLRAMNAGMNPDKTDGINRRALPMAIDNLNEVMIEAILAAGANPNLPGKEGETPLYKAVTWGHEGIIKMLLQAGANPNLPTATGITPMQAAQNMNNERIQNLLANPQIDITEPAEKIVAASKVEKIPTAPKAIIKEQPLSPPEKQPIPTAKPRQQSAEATRNIEIAKRAEALAKKLANAKITKTPAPSKKRVEAIKPVAPTASTPSENKTLPQKKAADLIPYIKETGSIASALVMAIQEENKGAAELLVAKIAKADLDQIDTKTGTTALLAAIEKKDEKTTGTLIDKGADILTIIAHKQHSPLSMAVSMNSLNLVKFMLDKSEAAAVKEALNNKEALLSPQYLAYNQPKLLNLLLAAGADPNYGGKEGSSPLLKGIEKGTIGLLPVYAKHQLDMNQVVAGKSLLEWAIKYNRIDWVNGFLAEGVDLNLKNKNDQTALEYAISFGEERAAIADLLR